MIHPGLSKQLIVHVGYSKCGSTTIQDSLVAHSSTLQSQGVLFPKVVAENPAWLRFFWESNPPLTVKKKHIASKFQLFKQQWRKEIRETRPHTVILSDEGLISLSAESVRKFSQFLNNEFQGYDVKIVIIVREPVSFFTSRCQQFISDRYFDYVDIDRFLHGKRIVSGESRADNIAMNPDQIFSQPISKYQSCFPNISIFSFEECAGYTTGFTSFFLRKCGCDIQIADLCKNESRSAHAIELMAFINNKLKFTKGDGRSYKDLSDLYKISGSKYYLPEPFRNRVEKKVANESQWLKEKTGIDYCSIPAQSPAHKWCIDQEFCNGIRRVYPSQRYRVRILIVIFCRMHGKNISCKATKHQLVDLLRWMRNVDPMPTLLSRFNFRLVLTLGKVSALVWPLSRLLKRSGFFDVSSG